MKYNKRQLELMAQGADMEMILAAATPDTDGNQTTGNTPTVTTPEAGAKGDGVAINAEVALQLGEALGQIETMTAAAATQATLLTETQATLANAQAAQAAAETTAKELHGAVMARVKTIAITMGKSAPADDISAADLAALHTQLDAEFKTNFKVGSQANKTQATNQTQPSVLSSRLMAAARNLPTSV